MVHGGCRRLMKSTRRCCKARALVVTLTLSSLSALVITLACCVKIAPFEACFKTAAAGWIVMQVYGRPTSLGPLEDNAIANYRRLVPQYAVDDSLRVDDVIRSTTGSAANTSSNMRPVRMTTITTQDNAMCDDECLRFRKLLNTWPADKPKAAIYFLIQKSSIKQLRKSLGALDRFFNDKFRYPIIVFFERDLDSPDDQRLVRSLTNSTVFMQLVQFELPPFLKDPVPPQIRGKNRVYGVGYRHMCRFHAKLVYEQPIVAGLEYAWRLDHDSFITRPIDYDIFVHMRQRQLVYGFVKTYLELPMWTTGLWPTVKRYIADNAIRTTFFNKWPRNSMYYNNFEVSKMSLWLSPEYRKYIEHIDRHGGIYYHRWGDAPIKSIAVAMFVPRDKTFNFKDIGYIHQFFRRP